MKSDEITINSKSSLRWIEMYLENISIVNQTDHYMNSRLKNILEKCSEDLSGISRYLDVFVSNDSRDYAKVNDIVLEFRINKDKRDEYLRLKKGHEEFIKKYGEEE